MPKVNPMPALALALILVVAALAGGCGGEDDSGGSVSIYADSGPKGAPELVSGDAASGAQNQRVPITPAGTPTAIYQEPVRELSAGMHLRAIANVTLTKCEITDYIPNQRAHTACQGTREYSYDPVEVKSVFRLVGGDSAPDLSGKGIDLGPTLTTRCTTAVHHCSIARDYELDYEPGKLDSGLDPADARWIVLQVTATAPQAADCKPPRATRCNVLAVETQKGQAMYWVQADASVPDPSMLPRDTSAEVPRLSVLTGHGDKNAVRKVVYSVELGPGEAIEELEGRQVEIDSLLKIRERNPQAPDIAGYLVLADSPTAIDGRYLISDTYDPARSGNEGGNCDTTCAQARPAVVTSLLACDVSAGRRYVNLVADASRAAAKPGETVSVAAGGYVDVSRAYAPTDSVDTGSALTDCDA